MLRVIFKIFIWVILIMTVLAVLDYAFQKWQFEEQLKMTKQEVKEEHKQTEGDPQVKARIKSLQLQTARQRMMHQVPEADVVVTNPTHLALAIRYTPDVMNAPRVVAKGSGAVAHRIKDVAMGHGIPVVENKKLAQNLYKLVNIGEEIPVQHYQAVAELLAYVYKFKGKTAG
jgi:flagellar biosynthetic protein FlhB